MRTSDEEKKKFAAESHAWNIQQPKFKTMFPEYCAKEMKDVPNMVKAESSTKTEANENKVSRAQLCLPNPGSDESLEFACFPYSRNER